MSPRTRRFLLAGTVIATGAALAYGVGASGPWALVPDPFPGQAAESERVDALRSAAENRRRIKRSLTDDLIAGRTGLWDAAAGLLAANGDDAGERAVLASWFPGPTPEASAAANLIFKIHEQLKDDPNRQQQLVTRLLAEYRARYSEPDREWLRHVAPCPPERETGPRPAGAARAPQPNGTIPQPGRFPQPQDPSCSTQHP
jgi:hypothetical protein